MFPVMSDFINDLEGHRVFAYEDPTLDYEWAVVRVYEHPLTHVLYMYSGAGCSCDYPLAGVEAWEDLIPILQMETVAQEIRKQMPNPPEVVAWYRIFWEHGRAQR